MHLVECMSIGTFQYKECITMKKWLLLNLGFVLVFVLVACGDKHESSETDEENVKTTENTAADNASPSKEDEVDEDENPQIVKFLTSNQQEAVLIRLTQAMDLVTKKVELLLLFTLKQTMEKASHLEILAIALCVALLNNGPCM